MAYWGHPDNDHPDFHLSARPQPRPASIVPRRPLSKDELRRLDEALREIERAALGKAA